MAYSNYKKGSVNEMKSFKDGNTLLKCDESSVVASEDEIKEILKDIGRDASKRIIAARVEKLQNSKDTA